MQGGFKSVASKSLSLVVLKYILANYRVGRRYRRGNLVPEQQPNVAFTRSTHDYLANMEQAFSSYLENGNLTLDVIQGGTILELGPGDTFAMALKFIADGANRVVCLDRFKGISDGETARAVYLELRSRLNDGQRKRFDGSIWAVTF